MFAGGKQAALVLGEGEHTIIEIEKVNLVCGETRVLDDDWMGKWIAIARTLPNNEDLVGYCCSSLTWQLRVTRELR